MLSLPDSFESIKNLPFLIYSIFLKMFPNFCITKPRTFLGRSRCGNPWSLWRAVPPCKCSLLGTPLVPGHRTLRASPGVGWYRRHSPVAPQRQSPRTLDPQQRYRKLTNRKRQIDKVQFIEVHWQRGVQTFKKFISTLTCM